MRPGFALLCVIYCRSVCKDFHVQKVTNSSVSCSLTHDHRTALHRWDPVARYQVQGTWRLLSRSVPAYFQGHIVWFFEVTDTYLRQVFRVSLLHELHSPGLIFFVSCCRVFILLLLCASDGGPASHMPRHNYQLTIDVVSEDTARVMPEVPVSS